MMLYFRKEHPLYEFNDDFYIDASRVNEGNYIFKFKNNRGAQVVLQNQDSKEPYAFLYYLMFENDYCWNYDKRLITSVITGGTLDDVLISVKKQLELIKNGTE